MSVNNTDSDQISALEQSLRSLPIIADALGKLEQGLPSGLWYHNLPHTLDVFHEALLFGSIDKLSARELELLGIAAAYHDTGFLDSKFNNEDSGAVRAVAAMKQFGGYSEEEIALVGGMIRDTKVISDATGARQIANSKLAGYLCDADLSNLGRTDFFDKLELVRQEVGIEKAGFLKSTLQLIGGHDWYSPAARSLREQQKRQNVRLLKDWVLKS